MKTNIIPLYMAKRKGPGRPKDKDPRKPVGARLRQSVIDRLTEIARDDKRSVAVLIEIAVEERYCV